MRMGTQEMTDCFLQTEMVKLNVSSTRPKLDNVSVNATRIYKDLYSRQGTIAGDFSIDLRQLQNRTQNFESSLKCRLFQSRTGDMYCCALRIRVPKGSFVAVEIKTGKNKFYIVMYDERWTIASRTRSGARVFIGSSNVVSLVYYEIVTKAQRSLIENQFVLRFQALEHPGLQVKRTSANEGFVQIPFYEQNGQVLTPLVDPWARVHVPRGHLIMVSLPAFGIRRICVALRAGDRNNETLLEICKMSVDVVGATLHNTSLLLIQIIGQQTNRARRSFRMDFSFHNESALPVKLADNTWNCSVPYRSNFLQHMSCETINDCHDVTDCLNASDLCGPGLLKLGGRCFFFLLRMQPIRTPDNKNPISWEEAAELCSLRGGRLASLHTQARWKDAIRLLPVLDERIFVGLKSPPATFPLWYKKTHQWTSGTMAYYVPKQTRTEHDCRGLKNRRCSLMTTKRSDSRDSAYLHFNVDCNSNGVANALCENVLSPDANRSVIPVNSTDRFPPDAPYVMCPRGHYTHRYLVCDVKSVCWSRDYSSECTSSPLTLVPPSFTCTNQIERVPYTLVCDHRADCFDSSDEDFCNVPPCRKDQVSCDNGQCIELSRVFDGWRDCPRGEDEEVNPKAVSSIIKATNIPPALVTLSEDGLLVVRPINSTLSTEQGPCPSTHFQCPDNGYCLPVFLRCNGVFDCPGKQDEDGPGCDSCPGFYRCRASRVCVHLSDLCDGHAHCQQNDDEHLCDLSCPQFCACRGLAFFCRHTFNASAYPLLRFLDATGSVMMPADLTENGLLIHLSLAKCGLVDLEKVFLPNLLSIDIRDNKVKSVSRVNMAGIPQLRELSLAGNPLVFDIQNGQNVPIFHHIEKLDLSRVVLRVLNVSMLSAFPNLHVLNLSDSGVQRVQGDGFHIIGQLRVVDLRGCPMTLFPRGMFHGLGDLQALYAHTFKLCCPAVLPVNFNLHHCLAPSDEISSCDNLLRGNVFSVSVFVLAAMALAGNAVSFIFRTYISKRETKRGYVNFVTHLSVSDFLMGVYLTVIGIADQVYRGTYLWNEVAWKHSVACKLAGFLSLLSSEVSALIMCLITMDRFLVLRFPFSRMHFSPTSSHMMSVAVWAVGLFLASVPLLPVTSHWEFYSQTGICIPLPVTRPDFVGYNYSFGIVIVLNFVVFVFISIGQLSIYWSVLANTMSVSNTTKKIKDLTIARRLITVAMTDFLCWFPIGVLGLMASNGVPIPGDVNVAVAIFVLPLNSAVNPCLYTLNVIRERRTRARADKTRALLLAHLKAGN